eukprot:PhF_6_TR41289/c0_g1_i2/m.62480/K14376/PAP; poly(A) polymerase
MAQRVINEDPPTAEELELDKKYVAAIAHTIESQEEGKRRQDVLIKLQNMVTEWVRREARKKGLGEDVAQTAGGRLFTSGSYRLGVHKPGSDIDVVVVVPQFIGPQDFFGSFYQALCAHKEVTNPNKVETARVPIISIEFKNVDIDLSLVPLPRYSVPSTINIIDPSILKGLSQTSAYAITGPAVPIKLLELIPKTSIKAFRECLRGVKEWASNRKVYDSRLAYPGGVALAVLVARICQLYPRACASTLITKFFFMYSTWFSPDIDTRRNQPIFLTPSLDVIDPDIQSASFNPNLRPNDAAALFPVITPTIPFQNTCGSMTRSTLRVVCEEFCRGASLLRANRPYEELWLNSEFFVQYKEFIQLTMKTKGKHVFKDFRGGVESKVRFALLRLESLYPQVRFHLFPKACINKPPPAEEEDGIYTGLIFIGIESETVKSSSITLQSNLQEFFEKTGEEVRKYPGKTFPVEGKIIEAKDIPEWVMSEEERSVYAQQRATYLDIVAAESARKRGTSTMSSLENSAAKRILAEASATPVRAPVSGTLLGSSVSMTPGTPGPGGIDASPAPDTANTNNTGGVSALTPDQLLSMLYGAPG